MATRLSDPELEAIRNSLRPESKIDQETLKIMLVRLAHDGSDASLEILRQARSVVPAALRGFFECAWDECSYFNFIAKVDEVCLTPDSLSGALAEQERNKEELEKECQALEDQLADQGVLVDLVAGIPLAVRLAYVRRLREKLGSLRYHGSGFVHFDGCTGSCDCCIQKTWCEVATNPSR